MYGSRWYLCVCVWLKFERAFSTLERDRLQLDNAFVFYRNWFRNPEQKLGKKSFCTVLDSKLWKELKKVQKQGRDEKTQEDYPKSGVYFCRCRVVFLRSFISALFLYFFQLLP